jgi:hypothetical protein
MERILEHMNNVSTKLVATGILPSATFYKNDLNITNKLKVFNKILVYSVLFLVSKALHTLIRDMEQFKAKLIEVEECRTKIAQIESAKVAAKQCLNKNKVYYNEYIFNMFLKFNRSII